MKSYKIICLTGTRADYPRVKPVLKELVKVKKFDVNLYVTGQHVEKLFGYTINEIKRDKFKILRKYRIFNIFRITITKKTIWSRYTHRAATS